MDDPEHAVLRRMLTKDFTVKRVNALRPEIEKMAGEFIDTMIAGGNTADLVQAYALPIPSLVISLLLGVPYSDHQFFQDITGVLMSRTATEEEKRKANGKIFGYLYELVARKQGEPDDALISRLIQEYLPTGELARETIAMNSFILLSAGHETTANMIGLGTLALLENPGTLVRIRDTGDPKVISGAVEVSATSGRQREQRIGVVHQHSTSVVGIEPGRLVRLVQHRSRVVQVLTSSTDLVSEQQGVAQQAKRHGSVRVGRYRDLGRVPEQGHGFADVPVGGGQ
ncbi:hypothetical protein JOF56_006969 [Kibdelosporangium banguiense]|uniref:Cytochrome P450 n=1 Tax=Kibdelosporangium banguiense TaxID=1365924 RepID=A0ABS4TQ91_9PSEU|nr:cytochrome P450 [Kibdelosporangium banguiense]MBP2326584.1 hypothetical protein [Kibdelosporangium banguiense]